MQKFSVKQITGTELSELFFEKIQSTLRELLPLRRINMCGITGIASTTPINAGKEISRMTDALYHRGPDDFGYVALSPGRHTDHRLKEPPPSEQANIFLGHRRLSIIDITGSQQPLSNAAGTVWVTFNGEIYNYRELRKSLKLLGHKFREKGDTEILLHLWEEYREGMLEHLVGMFAFAIYDSTHDRLFLARDRFGQKPLYYMTLGSRFYFASELQALKQINGFPESEINMTAAGHFFRYGYIPSPLTFYRNVYSLMPGHFLLRDKGHNCLTMYWKPAVTGELETVVLDEVQEKIDKSVASRMISDVPLGAFLSGGIDSAILTASMAEQKKNESIETFTISTGNSWCDESAEAELAAKHLNTTHHTFTVKPDLVEISEKLARHYGQPFADSSSVMTYYVSREAVKFVKAAISGDGGDELFGGYGGYVNSAKYAIFGKLPSSLRSILAHSASCLLRNSQKELPDSIFAARPIPQKGENISCLYHEYWRKKIFSDDFLGYAENSAEAENELFVKYYNDAVSDNPIDRWMEADQRMYLADDILAKVDTASMAVSLECRAPFLDHRLAEFANRISAKRKLKGGTTKAILKELLTRRLPQEIVKRPKKGFAMPLDNWLTKSPLKDWAYSQIFDNSDTWQPFLNKKAVTSMWQSHQNGERNHAARLWQIISIVLSRH